MDKLDEKHARRPKRFPTLKLKNIHHLNRPHYVIDSPEIKNKHTSIFDFNF